MGKQTSPHEHVFRWDDRTAYDRCVTCQCIRRRCYECKKPMGVFPKGQTPSVTLCSEVCERAFARATGDTTWKM